MIRQNKPNTLRHIGKVHEWSFSFPVDEKDPFFNKFPIFVVCALNGVCLTFPTHVLSDIMTFAPYPKDLDMGSLFIVEFPKSVIKYRWHSSKNIWVESPPTKIKFKTWSEK